MRQVATAPDGVALKIFGFSVGDVERDVAFILEEDGVRVPGEREVGEYLVWSSARLARSAAWERFVERSRAIGITEHQSANGGIGCLMWRTE